MRVLELYSGIGGMRMAVERSWPEAIKRYTAIDVNRVANSVYHHNFSSQPICVSIENLDVGALDHYDVWTLAPPCQPYTTAPNSLQRDLEDPRSRSFMHVVNALRDLTNPPKVIVLENVPGFASSKANGHFLDVLASLGYECRAQVLSPYDLGIPNSRPRYFAVATLDVLRCTAGPPPSDQAVPRGTNVQGCSAKTHPPTIQAIPRGTGGLDSTASAAASPDNQEPLARRQLCCYLEGTNAEATAASSREDHESLLHQHYAYDPGKVSRYYTVLDIVTGEYDICNCFTKNYGRHVHGSGSLIATSDFAHLHCHLDRRGRLHLESDPYVPYSGNVPERMLLRLFTPGEIARLHGFPEGYSFPPHVRRNQQYALLGNSLSVDCVAHLLTQFVKEPHLWR